MITNKNLIQTEATEFTHNEIDHSFQATVKTYLDWETKQGVTVIAKALHAYDVSRGVILDDAAYQRYATQYITKGIIDDQTHT